MSTDEIKLRLHNAHEEFFNLRFQFTVGNWRIPIGSPRLSVTLLA